MEESTTETLAASQTEPTVDGPASASASSVSTEAPPDRGDAIGRYVVLGRLGAGAMGVVLAAFDPELDRKVAVKLLKTARGESAAARTRLQREAQALAKLAHPNVVGVHDVGAHGSSVFVAMEYVSGQTIGDWLGETSRDWRDVLAVFGAAGRGLAAAHAAGLVHRDIKPDNLMIGDDGRVRVMDFGLARTDADGEQPRDLPASVKDALATPLTRTGALLGTPAYMSPEQFLGLPATPASDQFSLCVTIYEALYGARPFAGKTIAALVTAVGEGTIEAAPRGTAVPGWVRAIVVKGLAIEPGDRHPSVDELLRLLGADPTLRRRRWMLGVATAGALGGGAYAVGTTAGTAAPICAADESAWAEHWGPERRAAVRSAIEAVPVGYASSTADAVERGLDGWLETWSGARVAACEATNVRGEQSEELLDLRMACLDDRLQDFGALVEVLADADADVVRNAAEAVAGLDSLSRCADADFLRAEIRPPSDPALAERVAEVDATLVRARAEERAGRMAAALEKSGAALTEAEAIEYPPLLARTLLRQGVELAATAKNDEAGAALRRAYFIALGAKDTAAAREAATQLLALHTDLAAHAEAHTWGDHGMALAKSMGDDEPPALLTGLGALARGEGKYDDSVAFNARALASAEARVGPDHLDVVPALNNLGNTALDQARLDDGRAFLERALAIRESALGPDHPEVGKNAQNLGNIATAQGRFDDARDLYTRALDIAKASYGPVHPYVAMAAGSLGNLAREMGDMPTARKHLEEALGVFEKTLGPEHPAVATGLMNLGMVVMAEGEHARALELQQRALGIQEKALGPEHAQIARTLTNLGGAALVAKDFELALKSYRRGLAIIEATQGAEHVDSAHPLTGIGRALIGLQRPRDAVTAIETAIARREGETVLPVHRADAHFTLARALWAANGSGDRARAVEMARRALKDHEEAGDASAKERGVVERWLERNAAD